MIRIRSIQEAYQMLKHDDPDTKITVGLLRRMVAGGTIPSIRAGRKILLNYDALLEFLSGSSMPAQSEEFEPGTIRPVPVNLK